MQVEVIKGKTIYTCDICGNELDLTSRDGLGFRVQNQFWKIFNFTIFDICGKHRKELLDFINNLKKGISKNG